MTTEAGQPTVTIIDNPERSQFEAWVDGEFAGELSYERREGVAVLPHTGVRGRFEGRGIGGMLAKFALDDARERGLAVEPLCPFIAAYIRRNPEYADLVG